MVKEMGTTRRLKEGKRWPESPEAAERRGADRLQISLELKQRQVVVRLWFR